MSQRAPVLVYGIDGATFDVMDPLLEQGRLPHFQRLIEQGTRATLTSWPPFLSPMAWTSIITGRNPGAHGVFDFLQRAPDSYRLRLTNATLRRAQPIWSIVGDRGADVVVANVPATFPPDAVNGFMISGLDAPGQTSRFTHPPELKDEIMRELGGYTIFPAARTLEERLTEGARAAEQQAAAFGWMMDKQPFDLAMWVNGHTDGTSHFFWHFQDASHPAHDPNARPELRNALADAYVLADTLLGRLLDRLPPDAHVLVVSDHGFGPLHEAISLHRVLRGAGFLTVSGATRPGLGMRLKKAIGRRVRRWRGMLPMAAEQDPYRAVDWSRTRAYPAGAGGGVFVNLRGREPEGVVEPGDEYKRVCDEVAATVLELKHPRTGEPLVERVDRGEAIFHGEAQAEAPDLVVVPRRGYGCTFSAETLKRGETLWDGPICCPRTWSGDHTPDGVFIAHGPAIRAGEQLDAASLFDVAPTALHLMGQAVPEDFDGRVLAEAIRPEHLQANPVAAGASAGAAEQADDDYTEDEEEEVRKRLEDLGYI